MRRDTSKNFQVSDEMKDVIDILSFLDNLLIDLTSLDNFQYLQKKSWKHIDRIYEHSQTTKFADSIKCKEYLYLTIKDYVYNIQASEPVFCENL